MRAQAAPTSSRCRPSARWPWSRRSKLKLLPGQSPGAQEYRTASTDAYLHYLVGRKLLRVRTAETNQRAFAAFQKALDLDPGFAPPEQAWASRALTSAISRRPSPRRSSRRRRPWSRWTREHRPPSRTRGGVRHPRRPAPPGPFRLEWRAGGFRARAGVQSRPTVRARAVRLLVPGLARTAARGSGLVAQGHRARSSQRISMAPAGLRLRLRR